MLVAGEAKRRQEPSLKLIQGRDVHLYQLDQRLLDEIMAVTVFDRDRR